MSENTKSSFYAKLKSLYESLQKANIKDFTSSRSDSGTTLTYLSWGAACDFFTKGCHEQNMEWTYSQEIRTDDILGYEIATTIRITDAHSDNFIEKTMTLPAMNNANRALKKAPYKYMTKKGEKSVEGADYFSINKNKQRCLVKCMTMFGLGLSLYMKDFHDLEGVATGTMVAERSEQDKEKRVAEVKTRIENLLKDADTLTQDKYSGYKDMTDFDELVALGIEIKKELGA